VFKFPWDVAAAIKARGGRLELDAGRAGFFVRGTQPTEAERAWIVANREAMLNHVRHLHPPESFLRLQRSGELNLERRK
jgi:hypothetical protein